MESPSDMPVKAVMIANRAGCPLVSVIKSPIFNADLLASFISAIGLFADQALEKIEEVTIRGLDAKIFVTFKHDLFIVAVLDSNQEGPQLREESIRALDAFYEHFSDEIASWDGSCSKFAPFEEVLHAQIEEYIAAPKLDSEQAGPRKLFKKMIRWLRQT